MSPFVATYQGLVLLLPCLLKKAGMKYGEIASRGRSSLLAFASDAERNHTTTKVHATHQCANRICVTNVGCSCEHQLSDVLLSDHEHLFQLHHQLVFPSPGSVICNYILVRQVDIRPSLSLTHRKLTISTISFFVVVYSCMRDHANDNHTDVNDNDPDNDRIPTTVVISKHYHVAATAVVILSLE